MRIFDSLGRKKVVLGMVHLGALPGTPFSDDDSFSAVKAKAVQDALALEAGGADGCVVQNAGDRGKKECSESKLEARELFSQK